VSVPEAHPDQPRLPDPPRDDLWLQGLLDDTWDQHFSDVPQANIVRIEFGKRAKRQLGSIRRDRKDPTITIITLNGLFRDPSIPEFIPKATLVHELTHYAHGFNSPLEQLHKHPHAGGVIRKEYAERGLEHLYVQQQKWLKENWPEIVRRNFGAPQAIRRRKRVQGSVPRPFWF
jgi:hypothetical protein